MAVKRFDLRQVPAFDSEDPAEYKYRILDTETDAYLTKTDGAEYRANMNRGMIAEYYLNRDCSDSQPDEIREFISRPVWQ